MKRIHIPGFIDVIKVDSASATNEPANNPHIDRRFASRRLPLNAWLIDGAVKLLSIQGQRFPAMRAYNAAGRAPGQQLIGRLFKADFVATPASWDAALTIPAARAPDRPPRKLWWHVTGRTTRAKALLVAMLGSACMRYRWCCASRRRRDRSQAALHAAHLDLAGTRRGIPARWQFVRGIYGHQLEPPSRQAVGADHAGRRVAQSADGAVMLPHYQAGASFFFSPQILWLERVSLDHFTGPAMRVCYCWILGLATCSPASHAVDLFTASYTPYTIVNDATGQVSGVAADKVVELMRRTAESFTLKVQPWPRSFQQVQIVQNSCAYPMVRTPQREERFKWVGPLAVNNYAVFARAGDHAHAADLAALKRYTIGTKRQDAASEYLTSKGYRIEAIATDIDNARKLKLRRFDYWATAQLVGLEILRQQELDKEIVPLFVFMHADLYLACHHSVGDEKIARWQQTLQSMDSDVAVF
jgi:polar amino acid transport system substrate-binding protein